MQLVEDINDKDGVSTVKYNKCWRQAKVHKEKMEQRVHEEAECHQAAEQWRLKVERCRAEEQAKKHISCLWFVMMELTVVDGGGHCIIAWQGQGKSVGVARVQLVHGAWAQV